MPDDAHAFAAEPAVPSREIAVIGSGYVGLTLSACLALSGHQVECTDNSLDRIDVLVNGGMPIVEEGLTEIVEGVRASGHLRFGIDNVAAAGRADFVFLCLPTPAGQGGAADLSYVRAVAREIGPHLRSGATVITKSTVPVGTAAMVEAEVDRPDVHVVSNPEFLAEGSAVRDSLHPDRIVIGARHPEVAWAVASLYGPSAHHHCVVTDVASAELIKYASNAYLATRLSFVNSLSQVCEAAGADIRSVVEGMGADHRIGTAFMQPGPGWGGSCFPKDTHALVRTAQELGCDFTLVEAAIDANEVHTARIIAKVERALGGRLTGRRIAVWGLTFKAGTDDLRDSPALRIAAALASGGAEVHGYDPTVSSSPIEGLTVHATSFAAGRNADAVIILTEWPEFAAVDLTALSAVLAGRVIVDTRNVFDPDAVRTAGYDYYGTGIRAPRAVASEVAA